MAKITKTISDTTGEIIFGWQVGEKAIYDMNLFADLTVVEKPGSTTITWLLADMQRPNELDMLINTFMVYANQDLARQRGLIAKNQHLDEEATVESEVEAEETEAEANLVTALRATMTTHVDAWRALNRELTGCMVQALEEALEADDDLDIEESVAMQARIDLFGARQAYLAAKSVKALEEAAELDEVIDELKSDAQSCAV